ncbi:class I SAM-dependent methyltransferase [Rhizobacter sp. P5_C2]
MSKTDATLTPPPCPKCAQASRLVYQARDYNRRLTDEVFHYYRCNACEFIFLAPIPADLGRYYPKSYYELPRSIDEHDALARRLQTWKLDVVKRYASGGKLLEIGPAYGLFSHLAKQAGFDVTVIEMDTRCCEYLRDTVGVKVIESDDTLGSLQRLPKFDVIVLWQVIEHLPDPWRVLNAVAERLAPNGVLVLDTPNPDAFQFRVLRRYWSHLDAPRHVTLIPARLLVEHAAGIGLKPLLLTAADTGANGWNGFGWAHSFKNLFGETPLGNAMHFLGRALAKLLIPIERTGWRGSSYTAAFRKESAQ